MQNVCTQSVNVNSFYQSKFGCFILKSNHCITTKPICKEHMYMYTHYVINAIMHEFPSHVLHESMLLKSARNDNLIYCCDDEVQIILPQWSMCCFTHSNSNVLSLSTAEFCFFVQVCASDLILYSVPSSNYVHPII